MLNRFKWYRKYLKGYWIKEQVTYQGKVSTWWLRFDNKQLREDFGTGFPLTGFKFIVLKEEDHNGNGDK